MNWYNRLVKVKQEVKATYNWEIASKEHGSLEKAVQAANETMLPVGSKSSEMYFCGLCKGFVPLLSFPHPHLGE